MRPDPRADVNDAWDTVRGSPNITVAVLDTGIDWNHPDLAGNMWTNEDGYHGRNIIDSNYLPMDDNQHSYDENLRLQNLWDGIDLMAALLTM